MEKQHNCGQDGAGFARHKARCRTRRAIHYCKWSNSQPIQEVLLRSTTESMKKWRYIRVCRRCTGAKQPHSLHWLLGYVRYGTLKIVSKAYILFTSKQLDAQKPDLVGNSIRTNVKELFRACWIRAASKRNGRYWLWVMEKAVSLMMQDWFVPRL
jgi:hypothetical protein